MGHGLLSFTEFVSFLFFCTVVGPAFIARVHWPPMNKFVCKLHGYIVYLLLRSLLIICITMYGHALLQLTFEVLDCHNNPIDPEGAK